MHGSRKARRRGSLPQRASSQPKSSGSGAGDRSAMIPAGMAQRSRAGDVEGLRMDWPRSDTAGSSLSCRILLPWPRRASHRLRYRVHRLLSWTLAGVQPMRRSGQAGRSASARLSASLAMFDRHALPCTCAFCGVSLDYDRAFCRTTGEGVPVALCTARCARLWLGDSPRDSGLNEAPVYERLVKDWRWREGR